jgi:hypothetical protein
MSQKVKYNLVFAILLFTVYFITGVIGELPKRPYSIHQWSQCDRASVALNFSQDDLNFFMPRVHNTTNGTGITGMEFPIVGYLSALCYTLFGFDELWYRLMTLLIVSSGIIAFFNMAAAILKNHVLAIIITFFAALSPLLFYYTPNFIPDAASLGFILVAWFFFFMYIRDASWKPLILFTIFASLSTLIKITSLISIVLIGLLIVLDYFSVFKVKRIAGKIKLLSMLLLVIIVTFLWYRYAIWLNHTYETNIFVLEKRNSFSLLEFNAVNSAIYARWITFYTSPLSMLLLLIFSVYMFIDWKLVNRFLAFITVGLYCGAICFFILMNDHFKDHDYMMLTAFPAIFFHFLLFGDFVTRLPLLHYRYWVPAVIIVFIFIIKDIDTKLYLRNSFNAYEEGMYGDQKRYNKYERIEPYLRSLGIKKDDQVISVYDNSNIITLYLMNQKGTTMHYLLPENDIMNRLDNKKYGYLIVNNDAFLENALYQKYMTNALGSFDGISIFRLP